MSEPEESPTLRDERFDAAMRAVRSFPDALAAELAKDEVTRGVHVTRHLDEPVENRFGTFTKKWEYVAGCEPLGALVEAGAGEIRVILTTPDAEKRLVSIAQTPTGWRPDPADIEVMGSEGPDDFIMTIRDMREGRVTGRPQVSYLGLGDLTGVRIVQGEEFSIGANADDSTAPGRVETVYAFVA